MNMIRHALAARNALAALLLASGFACRHPSAPLPASRPTVHEMNIDVHALVVAVGAYDDPRWPDLPGASADIEAVAAALSTNRVQAQVLRNPGRAEFVRALSRLLLDPRLSTNAHVLVYVAGHGYSETLVNGAPAGYLALADTPHPDRDRGGFLAGAFHLADAEELSLRTRARHVLFMFDACFSGALFAGNDPPVPPQNDEERRRREWLPARQFITAGSAHEKVPDNSQFRREFVGLLTGAAREPVWDGYLTGTEIGQHMQKTLPRTVPPTTPLYGSTRDAMLGRGDFVLRLSLEFSPPPPDYAVPVMIETGLKGVSVRLDGEWRGKTGSDGRMLLRASPGSYFLECQYENSIRASVYKPSRAPLVVNRQWTTQVVRVELERKDVSIMPP